MDYHGEATPYNSHEQNYPESNFDSINFQIEVSKVEEWKHIDSIGVKDLCLILSPLLVHIMDQMKNA